MIQLVIAWTCVGVFIATAVITLLALVRVIRLAERKYLDRLFKALVLEIVAVCIGVFTGRIESPKAVEKQIVTKGEEKGEAKGREAAVEAFRPEIRRLADLVEQRDAIIRKNIGKFDLTEAEKDALKQPVKLNPKILDDALARRVAAQPR